MALFNKLSFIQDEIKTLPELENRTTDFKTSSKTFWSRSKRAARLMLAEKEILAFAIVQWAAIGAGYLLWVQMLGWIPDEVWQGASRDEDSALLPSLILLAWSFVIVGIVAFPVGVMSACMGAVHLLRRSGQPSTIAACLGIVGPRAGSIWAFHWADGWATVNQILERLPKKDDDTTPAQRALSEALYYAWKIGSAGVLPGLISGKSLIPAGRESIRFVKKNIKDVVLLRAGYSSLCWIIGIGAYVGGIVLAIAVPGLMPEEVATSSGIKHVYLSATIPLMIALAIVVVILRPVYVIAMTDLYADHLEATGQPVELERNPSRLLRVAVGAGVLGVMVLTAAVFRHELGLMDLLARLNI